MVMKKENTPRIGSSGACSKDWNAEIGEPAVGWKRRSPCPSIEVAVNCLTSDPILWLATLKLFSISFPSKEDKLLPIILLKVSNGGGMDIQIVGWVC